MILKAAKRKLKKVLGSSYSEEVVNLLNEKNIVNRLGNQHAQTYVIAVFNGERHNYDVEDAIYELYSKRKKNIEKRKSMLI